MFRTLVINEMNLCNRLLIRSLNTTKQSSWDVLAGLCIERVPVVTPPLNELQKKYKDLLYTIEVEKSLKSDHEIKHENDKRYAQQLKNENAEVDMEAVSKLTAQDFEDAATEEAARFQLADIETEADRRGDESSPWRRLQRHLVLVQRTPLGDAQLEMLPQTRHRDGETLRQTAERALAERCGGLSARVLGNAPCGFYKYKYPAAIDGKVGAKIFFYYALYSPPGPAAAPPAGPGAGAGADAGRWLTRTELRARLPPRYARAVADFLIDE